jgi:hypothetical protein
MSEAVGIVIPVSKNNKTKNKKQNQKKTKNKKMFFLIV